ncbi:hypothetical protein HG535_0C03010 [Zygotorulaspora mrakii]|uniref:Pre-mRNA-splicing factor 38 n=1 Tax=Zygotorulaspora mrakii TaxID=42260 RepID=A0A7H9B1U4_ZYGMR|nr:uncharacterized protein HG535_0C03010 [Zygotorulaspora mrakii]QLG71949.1 hypothetical protein HG535_0C03010 [Zygotorulaspora mrakii]
MPQEYNVESFLSTKQLNHQSVSLIIPRLTRERIHNAMYYKTNLNTVAMRGDTMNSLAKVIVRDLGTLTEKSINQANILGGVEFNCLLMKMVELRPTWEQLSIMLQGDNTQIFNNKYIVALVLTYLRIQYFFLQKDDALAKDLRNTFSERLNDYRKLKSVSMNMDCWSLSQRPEISIVHMDELVEWLATQREIWGIPLGKCQWCQIFEEDNVSTEDESESESESGSESRSESETD